MSSKPLPHGYLLARVDEFGCRGNVKRLFCGSIVVEFALPILAHNPDTKFHLSLLLLVLDILRLLAVVSTPG